MRERTAREMWNERYSEAGYAYGDAPNDHLRDVADQIPKGGRVLCLAEGEGRTAVFLAECGHDVTAIDVAEVGLRKAEALAVEWNPDEQGWDAIVAIWAHLPPSVRRSVHGQIHRALRPGGVFVLEAYTPEQLALGTGGPKAVEWLMTAEGLREELVGMEVVRLHEMTREVHEGRYHRGLSAVVQCVARKAD
jgi:SAM-dependent methyltransferase